MQLRVLCLGCFQDGDVGIGIFPERQKILVLGASFRSIGLQGVGTSQAQVRQGKIKGVDASPPARFVGVEQPTMKYIVWICIETPVSTPCILSRNCAVLTLERGEGECSVRTVGNRLRPPVRLGLFGFRWTQG